MKRNYAVFIMSHGRADNVKTYDSLRKFGYTGRIFLVIDTDDIQQEQYIQNFGKENVLIFDKKVEEKNMDTGDVSGSMKCVVFARNKCFDFADELGLDYFVEADDDYFSFAYRTEKEGQLKQIATTKLDELFEATFQFLDDTNALAVAPAQDGDYIGGLNGGTWKNKLKRKCMNLFFCKTDKRFQFIGRINEDVNTYTRLAQVGGGCFSLSHYGVLIKHQHKPKKAA